MSVRPASRPVQLPLLDRLRAEDAPDTPHDAAGDLEALRQSVRRDLEMLLNARRRWRAPPASLRELACSPLLYGIPDCAALRYGDRRERERLRAEIERILRDYEPRLVRVRVTLREPDDVLDGTLRLHIDAMLHAEPAPAPVAYETVIEGARPVGLRETDV
jgi:type VI secretion system protein ImpF